MKKYVNGKYIELTSKETAAMETELKRQGAIENRRSLTESEVFSMLISSQINNLVVDDNAALRMMSFYPEWENGNSYSVGFKIQRNGKLWRVVQAHTSQTGWEPENAASLWEQIVRSYSGAEDDPIPYDGNMRLEKGKYYIQNDVIYLCVRGSGNPVYHALVDLVELYVEVIV
jgi:hypothetical protein